MKNIQKNTILIILVVALVVGAVAFYGGMQYQKMQRSAQFGQGARALRTGQGGQNGARPVVGQIISSDDKSITVKLQDGSSKIILLSDSTPITEATTAAKSALQTGKNGMVIGKTNSNG